MIEPLHSHSTFEMVPHSFPETTLSRPRLCTFQDQDWQVLVRGWYPIARSVDVTTAPMETKLLDVPLCVWRGNSGMISIAHDRCPHRGTPLSLGREEEDHLVCRGHGLKFNVDGKCSTVAGERLDRSSLELRLSLFPAHEHAGLVWTCLSTDPLGILPPLPEWLDRSYQQALPEPMTVKASSGRQMESFLDVAHFAWIHHETFGDRSNPVVPAYSVERIAGGLKAVYRSEVGNYMRQDGSEVDTNDGVTRIFEVSLPFTAKLTVVMPRGAHLIILHAASPVSARVTRLFAPLLRNYDLDTPLQPFIDYNNKIFNEDRAIVENQCPEDLPIDLTEEVHIRADRTSIEYRKMLGELGLGRNYTT